MKFDSDIYHRRSIRLKGFDYTAAGAYFVTMCAHGRECLFGEISGGEMVLNEAGEFISEWWQAIPVHFPSVELGEYVIMPNHMHGIIIVGAGSPRPGLPGNRIRGGGTPPLRPTLGQIVGYFKYQSTRRINQFRNNPGTPVWQRNYYERVIRDEDELARARRYIQENTVKWESDPENLG